MVNVNKKKCFIKDCICEESCVAFIYVNENKCKCLFIEALEKWFDPISNHFS